jgi:hypothetical protein
VVRIVLDTERSEDRAEHKPSEANKPKHKARPDNDEPEPGSDSQRERHHCLRIQLQRAGHPHAPTAQIPLDIPTSLSHNRTTLIERKLLGMGRRNAKTPWYSDLPGVRTDEVHP